MVEAVVALLEGLAFGGDVAVVPAVERCAELGDELKGRAQGVFGALHGIGGAVPRPVVHRSWAEGIDTPALEAVPKGHGEAQVFGHGLAADQRLGVVVLEGEGIFRIRAFVGNFFDTLKKFAHGFPF